MLRTNNNKTSERIVMCYEAPEFEVIIKGHSIVKVANGGVGKEGLDFNTDVKNTSTLGDIPKEVLKTAQEVRKPKRVA